MYLAGHVTLQGWQDMGYFPRLLFINSVKPLLEIPVFEPMIHWMFSRWEIPLKRRHMIITSPRVNMQRDNSLFPGSALSVSKKLWCDLIGSSTMIFLKKNTEKQNKTKKKKPPTGKIYHNITLLAWRWTVIAEYYLDQSQRTGFRWFWNNRESPGR